MKNTPLIVLHVAAYGAAWLILGQQIDDAWPLVFSVALIWISVVDSLRYEIPDTASVALFLSGLFRMAVGAEQDWLDHILGGAIWPVLFWVIAAGYAKLRGFAGLGFGDVKLMAGIGIWVGFLGAIWVVLAAALAGIATLIVIGLRKETGLFNLSTSAVAFGPFLCLSAWAIWLQGTTT